MTIIVIRLIFGLGTSGRDLFIDVSYLTRPNIHKYIPTYPQNSDKP